MVSSATWTYEETLIAFYVYCLIPFRSANKNNPLIIEYAKILGRTPSALNMKIGNLGRLDPSLQTQGIKGLTHGAKLEAQIWEEFTTAPDTILYRCLTLIETRRTQLTPNTFVETFPGGGEALRHKRERLGQQFFRNCVLNAYNSRCCISGITSPELLEACHIISWSEDSTLRTHPSNGLCLNPFFHKGYDLGYVGISPDYSIYIAASLLEDNRSPFTRFLTQLNGTKITLPSKFYPRRDLLALRFEQFLAQNS